LEETQKLANAGGNRASFFLQRDGPRRYTMLYMLNTTLCQRVCLAGIGLWGLSGIHTTAFAKGAIRWDALDDVGNLGRVASVEVSPFDSRKIIAGGDVLGAGLTDDGGATWQQTIGFFNSQDNDITFHPANPNIVWMGTLGGPYESTDGGKTWVLKREGMPALSKTTITVPIERVIFDPHDVNTLLAVAGNHRHMGYGKPDVTEWGGVWKSTDGGEHWKKISTIDPKAKSEYGRGRGAMINDVGFAAGSSSVLYACSDRSGVFKSADGGVSWSKINAGLPNTEAWSIALHPTEANILWVSMGGGAGVYKSMDGGASWKKSSAGMTDKTDVTSETVFRTIAVARSDPNYLYCASWEGGGSTYRSTDGGKSWTEIIKKGDHGVLVDGTGNSTGVAFQRINVDPNNAKHVVGACEGSVVQSWDAGTTWKDLTSFSTMGGRRGTGYSGMCGTHIGWDTYRPGLVFTLGDDEGKLERSENYLWSWKLARSPNLRGPYNGSSDCSFAADGTVYVGNGQFGDRDPGYGLEPIIKSSDFGGNWNYVKRPHGAIGENRAVYVNPLKSSEVWCITGGSSTGTLYKSEDGGEHWRVLCDGNGFGLWNIAVDPNNPGTMYLGGTIGIYKSTDGEHFSVMRGSPASVNYEYAYVDPVDSETIYGVSFNSGALGGLYRYRGGVWTRLFANAQARAVAVDPANDQRIVVATMGWTAFDKSNGSGIWISEDGGGTWTPCDDGLRMIDGPAIAFNPDKSGQLIFATNGAGFYVTDVGDSTPHGGGVRSVTDRIAASDYDDGVQGFDAGAIGRGNVLRGLTAGQWIKYRVNVPASGYYDIDCRVASGSGSRFHLEFNGVNATGPVTFASRNGNGSVAWTDVSIPHVMLTAGDQYMKLVPETDSLEVDSYQLRKD
jgi:photosystem II stability/assembly factor-like uncharacterized protein